MTPETCGRLAVDAVASRQNEPRSMTRRARRRWRSKAGAVVVVVSLMAVSPCVMWVVCR
jgi:hypothetical protein